MEIDEHTHLMRGGGDFFIVREQHFPAELRRQEGTSLRAEVVVEGENIGVIDLSCDLHQGDVELVEAVVELRDDLRLLQIGAERVLVAGQIGEALQIAVDDHEAGRALRGEKTFIIFIIIFLPVDRRKIRKDELLLPVFHFGEAAGTRFDHRGAVGRIILPLDAEPVGAAVVAGIGIRHDRGLDEVEIRRHVRQPFGLFAAENPEGILLRRDRRAEASCRERGDVVRAGDGRVEAGVREFFLSVKRDSHAVSLLYLEI